MTVTEMKQKAVLAVEENRETIITIAKKIFENPELGYKEVYATKLVSDYLKELELEVEEPVAVTGCKSVLNKHKKGPVVALMGELDAILVQDHPEAVNGKVHACGHNIQIGGLLGAVTGLVLSGVLPELEGSVDVITTPAEEFIELEYRENLRKDGIITYFGGKQELIERGFFDTVDFSIMFHSLDIGQKAALLGPRSNGFIGKKVKFIGKESHAGSAPEQGVNALNAASLAIVNIHAQRETFKDSDRVRVHPIITKGGDIVNVVPADVRMETYVRARTIEGMIDANKKVDRALRAGASAVGADIEIMDIPGYLPILQHVEMDDLLRGNLNELGFEHEIIEGGDFTGSFDFGDISHLMPSLHPMFGGVSGAIHTRDFTVVDEDLAILLPAKAIAMTVIDLLSNNAAIAKNLKQRCKPVLTKSDYLKLLASFASLNE